MANSDVNNFSSSSLHRLPTLSASQALQNLSSTPRKPIATGLNSLDAALQGREYESSFNGDHHGGISRGEVTEIYGPPGIGKTALAMQVSANALRAGGSVVWLQDSNHKTTDASHQCAGTRLKSILSGSSSSEEAQSHSFSSPSPAKASSAGLDHFHHFSTPTLPHLLALLTHPAISFPPLETSLIVIDSVSTLFALAFPKPIEIVDRQQISIKKSDAAQWASTRRWALMGDFISKLGKLAATRNLAVLLTSQTTTRIRSETGAVLHPAVSSTSWDTGIGSRIVLFRDWMFQTEEQPSSRGEYLPGVRFAGVVKAKSVSYEGVGRMSTFRVVTNGLQEVKVDQADIKRIASPTLPTTSLKRKRGEIADNQSEEEEAASDQEFGWAGDESALNAEELLE